MAKAKRAALYVRVSTDSQTVENQIRELRQVAERRGWEVIGVYSDAGISGARGRDGRPGLNSMLKTPVGGGSMWRWRGRLIGSGAHSPICSTSFNIWKRAAWTCIWTNNQSTPRRRWAS
jgi:predicted site-specific integrase-resolvase